MKVGQTLVAHVFILIPLAGPVHAQSVDDLKEILTQIIKVDDLPPGFAPDRIRTLRSYSANQDFYRKGSVRLIFRIEVTRAGKNEFASIIKSLDEPDGEYETTILQKGLGFTETGVFYKVPYGYALDIVEGSTQVHLELKDYNRLDRGTLLDIGRKVYGRLRGMRGGAVEVSLELVDDDDQLIPGDRAELRFKLKNVSSTQPLKSIVVKFSLAPKWASPPPLSSCGRGSRCNASEEGLKNGPVVMFVGGKAINLHLDKRPDPPSGSSSPWPWNLQEGSISGSVGPVPDIPVRGSYVFSMGVRMATEENTWVFQNLVHSLRSYNSEFKPQPERQSPLTDLIELKVTSSADPSRVIFDGVISPKRPRGKTATLQYPSLAQIAGRPEGSEKALRYYRNGDPNDTLPGNSHIRALALRAARTGEKEPNSPEYGIGEIPESKTGIDVEKVVRNVAYFIHRALVPKGYPDGEIAAFKIAQSLWRGTTGYGRELFAHPDFQSEGKPIKSKYGHGVWICQEHSYLFGSLLRALGVPVRDVNIYSYPFYFPWHEWGNAQVYYVQDAASEVFFDGKWHFWSLYASNRSGPSQIREARYMPNTNFGRYTVWIGVGAYVGPETRFNMRAGKFILTDAKNVLPYIGDSDAWYFAGYGYKGWTTAKGEFLDREALEANRKRGQDELDREFATVRSRWSVYVVRSPVAAMVELPDGRRVGSLGKVVVDSKVEDWFLHRKGTTPAGVFNEVEGALYLPAGIPFYPSASTKDPSAVSPQVIAIPTETDPGQGKYRLVLKATGNGPYKVETFHVNEKGLLTFERVEGTVRVGDVLTLDSSNLKQTVTGRVPFPAVEGALLQARGATSTQTTEQPSSPSSRTAGVRARQAVGRGDLPSPKDLSRNDPRMVQALERACGKGQLNYCGQLATLYEMGRHGAPRRPERAAELYRRVCDGGLARGCGDLARLHARGKGVHQDMNLALRLYLGACDDGDKWSCGDLGRLYAKGEAVARSVERAAGFYRKACDAGDEDACIKIAPYFAAPREVRNVRKSSPKEFRHFGKLSHGDRVAKVYKLFGDPESVQDDDMGSRLGLRLVYRPGDQGVFWVVYDQTTEKILEIGFDREAVNWLKARDALDDNFQALVHHRSVVLAKFGRPQRRTQDEITYLTSDRRARVRILCKDVDLNVCTLVELRWLGQ